MTKSKTPYLIVFILFLFVQFLYVKFFQEPYPAILAPGFGVIEQNGKSVVLSDYKVCITREGQCYKELPLDIVLPALPSHMRPKAMETLISRGRNESKESKVRDLIRSYLEHKYDFQGDESISISMMEFLGDLSNGSLRTSIEEEVLLLKSDL